MSEIERSNKNIVCNFYNALAVGDTNTVHRLLAPDIDWWFHGPPAHKHNLMRLLIGGYIASDDNNFFKPLSVVGIRSVVVAEGYHVHESQKIYWVHVWTVKNENIITEVKEYLNTSVMITRFKNYTNAEEISPRSPKCQNMWQSELADNTSMPSLLLAL